MGQDYKPSILFIEDELDLVESVKEIFVESGFDFVYATTEAEAIIKLQMQKFDCILTDIALKKGSGEQVIEKIRNKHRNENKNTPIIVVSSNIDMPLIKKVRPLIQGAFVKPYKIKDLLEKVKTLID